MSILMICILFNLEEVSNGVFPQKLKKEMYITEDLRISGNEDSPHFYWSGAGLSIAVDQQGHIYLCDPGENKVFEYDADGSFVRFIGRVGNGPGEWNQVVAFHIIKGNVGMSFDYQSGAMQFQYFRNGKFTKSHRPKVKGVFPIYVTPSQDGELLMGQLRRFDFPNNKVFYQWALFDKDLNILQVIAKNQTGTEVIDPDSYSTRSTCKILLKDMLRLGSESFGVGVFSSQNQVYTAASGVYTITRLDQDLKPNLVVKKKYKPIVRSLDDQMSQADFIVDEMARSGGTGRLKYFDEGMVKDTILDAELAPVKNPIFNIVIIDKEHFMVIHDFQYSNGSSSGDLFTVDGDYVGKAALPAYAGFSPGGERRLLFYNDFMYALIKEDEDQFIVRYRFQIKAKK